MTEGIMRRWVPKALGDLGEVSSRFYAIFRDCYLLPREVYAIRRQNGGQLPKADSDRYMTKWANAILRSLGVRLETKGVPCPDPVLLVGNHISYIDIPLVMAATPTLFVAKKEIASWPLIGYACKSVDLVWVERGSGASRRDAGAAIAPAILERGQKVCLFPSGTTTLDEKVAWKRGAFRIAKDHGIRVQPFRIRYSPLRRAAFVGNDLLVPHLWKLLAEGSVHATLEWGETRTITDIGGDCEDIQRWTMEGLADGAATSPPTPR
jgi:1-acyl-sn-glycerol-3-phosphate acyltransferase